MDLYSLQLELLEGQPKTFSLARCTSVIYSSIFQWSVVIQQLGGGREGVKQVSTLHLPELLELYYVFFQPVIDPLYCFQFL